MFRALVSKYIYLHKLQENQQPEHFKTVLQLYFWRFSGSVVLRSQTGSWGGWGRVYAT